MDPVPPLPQEPDSRLRNTTLAVHGLFAASFLFGITSVIGLVIAYMKRGEAAGTIYASHMTYAIRTFWIGLAFSVAGFVLSIVGLGLLIWALGLVWFIIRLVRSFVYWYERRPIDTPERFL